MECERCCEECSHAKWSKEQKAYTCKSEASDIYGYPTDNRMNCEEFAFSNKSF